MPTVPLLDQLRDAPEGALRGDLSAGLTTAVMLVPQGMAYAMLAGLDPIVGLYASTVPVAVYALLGTSRQLAVGPVAMVSLMVASGVAPIAGGDPLRYAALAAILALMVGAMQWLMGMAGLGALVRLLSTPVITGFTTAAAIIIGTSQLPQLLGIPLPRGSAFETLGALLPKLGALDPATAGLSLLSVVALVALKNRAPQVPRFLLVVTLGGLAVWALALPVAVVGEVPAGLPALRIPSLSTAGASELLPIAAAISLVSFMESISVAQHFARHGGTTVDASQELKALGAANIASGLFSGYPVTGGFSRTAVNVQAGAVTGRAGLITVAAVVATLLFLTPLFAHLPRAVLAAIILTAVAGLIHVDEMRHLWRDSRADFAVMALTAAATLTLGIEPGILIGVAAGLLRSRLLPTAPGRRTEQPAA